MSSWANSANATIARVHRELPAEASLEERTRAVDAAYPFGARTHFPYKAWLKARRAYLVKFGYRPRREPKNPIDLFPRDPVTGRPVIG
jgi:hypothetical protein